MTEPDLLLGQAYSEPLCLPPLVDVFLSRMDTSERNRVIAYRTNVDRIDPAEAEELFRGYDRQKDFKNKSTQPVCEFLSERFVRENCTDCDTAEFFQDNPHRRYSNERYTYMFVDGGRRILVRDKEDTKTITEISRVLHLQKYGESRVFVFDPILGRQIESERRYWRGMNKIKHRKNMAELLGRELIGSDCPVSHIAVYPSDLVLKNIPGGIDECFSRLMKEDEERLALIFSDTSKRIGEFGRRVLNN